MYTHHEKGKVEKINPGGEQSRDIGESAAIEVLGRGLKVFP
jgi:hypothetical protein